ncbi:hypothetical protein DE146DRAFT_254865 [Phaeosphaeria sp. MPI-PUGE-AT-0046c]|nr:hypothetical protein DE146DRAFT_254865 [Phaeosphaeria sp. MPI-PUGE-AT-0046c]
MSLTPDSSHASSISTVSSPIPVNNNSISGSLRMDTTQFLRQCAEEDRAELNDYIMNRTPSTTADLGDSFFDYYMSDDVRHVSPFQVSTCLIRGCAKSGCARTNGLSPCPACKAILYCSHEHQRLGRPDHRLACAKVKKAQMLFDKESRLLRNRVGSTVFEETSYSFCRTNSLKYSTACVALAETLLKSNNAHSIWLALNHLLKLLRLQRSDPMGAGDVVPAIYIRLGQDQNAFDFCYWWATIGQREDVDWLNYRGLFLDTQNADAFGEAEIFTKHGMSLSQVVAITLLKIRLVIDLQSIHQARELAGPVVPQEILDVILEYVTFSSILTTSKNVKQQDLSQHIKSLREQIGVLHGTVQGANQHFWPALIEPGDNLTARPTLYSPGDEGHMQLVLQHNYNAWAESTGAIDVIKSYQDAHTSS